jgi:hypothetical protein
MRLPLLQAIRLRQLRDHAVPVDIIPCLRGHEADFAFGNTHDGAATGVEIDDGGVRGAAEGGEAEEEREGGPEFGAGEGRERVEVDVVEGGEEGVG